MPMFSGAGAGDAMLAALVAAAASFMTADLVIYPKYGNLAAVIADALITALVLAEVLFLSETTVSWPGLALVTVLIAAGEWYYHSYLARLLFSGRRR